MLLRRLTLGLAAATAVAATNVFVADYGGHVTTFSLTDSNGTYRLQKTFESTACAPDPSWLTVDLDRGLLFCLNEGRVTKNGSVSSYIINGDGSLKHVKNQTTIDGPVSGVIYGNPSGQRALAIAHYNGGAVSSYLINDSGNLTFNNALIFKTPHGPNPRQNQSHAHEVVLDPTGQYIVAPDLGADLVHVLSWDSKTLKLKELNPLHTYAGAGPRHAAFWNPYSTVCEGCTTFMYLLAEIGGTVTGYSVKYLPNKGGLAFTQVYNSTTFGQLKQPPGTAPAEIHVTPDNKYITISNRNDSSFSIPQPNGKTLSSDSLSTFALNDDGTLTFHQLWPAGGSFPRHYSTNAVGSLVGVGAQYSQEAVLMERDVSTGLIGATVARVPLNGQVTNVVFAEQKALGVLGG